MRHEIAIGFVGAGGARLARLRFDAVHLQLEAAGRRPPELPGAEGGQGLEMLPVTW
jgi:hypothetical protein